MAKFPTIGKRSFGAPPLPDETHGNLSAPEVAPAAPAPRSAVDSSGRKTRKKTGRTVLFSTRVSEEFDSDFRAIAEQDNLLLTRLLELSLDAYRRQRKP